MIEVAPAPDPLRATVRVPGSKYEANRFLIAAALTDGTSRIAGAPDGNDIEAAVSALSTLGARITRNADNLEVRGLPGAPDPEEASAGLTSPVAVSVGESGTLLRFLTAAAATAPRAVSITGTGRIGERPISGLVAALEELGGEVDTTGGYAPLTVRSGTLRGGDVRVAARESSQFASALLLAAPRASGAVRIELEDEPVSASYLDLTVSVMARCGVRVERRGRRRFEVAAGERYVPGEVRISGDWTTASYFFAAAAIAPGTVSVEGLDPDSPQGERGFPEVLRRMGCEVTQAPSGDGVRITVSGARRLRGVTVDMGSMPDAAPTLAAVAPFAEGRSRLLGIGHLRHKESDRIAALADGLSRLGARVTAADDGLEIAAPSGDAALRPATVDPRGDHRIAMALALAGLRVSGVRVRAPEVVGKSFPDFWSALSRLGARVSTPEVAH